jgi:hypothetical protein
VPRIICLFIATRGLDTLVQDATKSSTKLTQDPVVVDRLLSELRSLLACCHEFLALLTKTAADSVYPKPVPRTLADALRGGTYAHSTHELQAAYISLERVYLEMSIAKAVELDVAIPVCSCAESLLHCLLSFLGSASWLQLKSSAGEC